MHFELETTWSSEVLKLCGLFLTHSFFLIDYAYTSTDAIIGLRFRWRIKYILNSLKIRHDAEVLLKKGEKQIRMCHVFVDDIF